jgi:hypothetical protein
VSVRVMGVIVCARAGAGLHSRTQAGAPGLPAAAPAWPAHLLLREGLEDGPLYQLKVGAVGWGHGGGWHFLHRRYPHVPPLALQYGGEVLAHSVLVVTCGGAYAIGLGLGFGVGGEHGST